MSDVQRATEKRFRLTPTQAERLHDFAALHHTSEDVVVGRALDILFSLASILDDQADRRAWSALSGDALASVWENDADAVYDDWRELYGVSAG